MNKKMLGIGAALAVVGVVLIAVTVYEELVQEPKPQDYHMGIPTGKYEWRSRNPAVTVAGVFLFVGGLGCSLVGAKWKSL